MNIKEFYYDLPEELIAQDPLTDRSSSRLLTLDKNSGAFSHHVFRDIVDYLNPEDCLVINNTKVIPARLMGEKEGTGAGIEVLLLKRKENDVWETLVKPGKKAKVGAEIVFGDGLLTGKVIDIVEEGNRLVQFTYEGIFEEVLDKLGEMPLPPYITHKLEDKNRYQTVYAKFEGSVAAPTAGLHFTPELIADMQSKCFGFEEVTLHVGAGTFLPVKADDAAEHPMHTEHFIVRRATVENLLKNVDRIVAVGTTSVRTLESLSALAWRIKSLGDAELERVVGQWELYDIPAEFTGREALQTLLDYMLERDIDQLKAATQIMITPLGYRFRIVRYIITNFHQPKSTLLLLVGAYVGDDWHKIYDYALANDFRFLSYGDSSLLIVE